MRHTYQALRNINAVKINSKSNKTLISAHTDDRGILVNGTIDNSITKNPTIFGCMRLDVLSSCLSFDLFKENEDGGLEMEYSSDAPTSLIFNSEYGHSAKYRLSNEVIIESHVEIDHISDIEWDISTPIHMVLYEQFRKVSSAFSKSDNSKFSIKDKGDGYLYFCVGVETGSDNMEFPVLECNGKWDSSYRWSIDNFNLVMKICSFYDEVILSISEKYGLIKVEPKTNDDYSWQYYLQASRSND